MMGSTRLFSAAREKKAVCDFTPACARAYRRRRLRADKGLSGFGRGRAPHPSCLTRRKISVLLLWSRFALCWDRLPAPTSRGRIASCRTTRRSSHGQATKASRLRAHASVLRPCVVVPTEKVEEPVDDEHRHFGEHVSPLASRLDPGSLDAHDDIAQDVRAKMSPLALAHGEGEDVGGRVEPPVGGVEFSDFVVLG